MYWIELVIGALVVVSPWVLGMGQTPIGWVNAGLGAVLILTGTWGIIVHRSDHSDPKNT